MVDFAITIFVATVLTVKAVHGLMPYFKSAIGNARMRRYYHNVAPKSCETLFSDDECTICLEQMSGASIRTFPCNHKFHSKCIDQWIYRGQGTCPNCKFELFETNVQ